MSSMFTAKLFGYGRNSIEARQSPVAPGARGLGDQFSNFRSQRCGHSHPVVKPQVVLDQEQEIHEFQGFVCRYLYLIYCTTPHI